MSLISIAEGRFEVDADAVANGLKITTSDLRQGLQSGQITSQSETGIDEDAGRYRLTFYSPTRRFRMVVDARGEVVKTSSADYSRRGAGKESGAT